MELLDTYVELCRVIGGMTDWVQGGGGNISIKDGDTLLLKESGVRIGDTTRTYGFVYTSIAKLQTCIATNNEDCSSSILGGTGKPSIEAFFHTVPSKYVVHLHPSHLLDTLCQSNAAFIPYFKPGLDLAKHFLQVYSKDTNLYYLQNHGIIITADTCETIFSIMNSIKGWTDINLVSQLFNIYKNSDTTVLPPIIKSFQMLPPRKINALTPDIVVFLKQPLYTTLTTLSEDLTRYYDEFKVLPNIICDGMTTYIVGNNIGKCYDIFEILCAVQSVTPETCHNLLSNKEQYALVNWDKEKHRQSK
jgi:ribulose-5-phosphate 4-epimerase/fuculose-1-phosphate aldolase